MNGPYVWWVKGRSWENVTFLFNAIFKKGNIFTEQKLKYKVKNILKVSQALLLLSVWLKNLRVGRFEKALFIYMSAYTAFLLNSNCMTHHTSNKVWAIKPLFQNIPQDLNRAKEWLQTSEQRTVKVFILCFTWSISKHKRRIKNLSIKNKASMISLFDKKRTLKLKYAIY